MADVRSSEFGTTQATLHIVIEEYGNQSSLCGICGGKSGSGAGFFFSEYIGFSPVSIFSQKLHSHSCPGILPDVL